MIYTGMSVRKYTVRRLLSKGMTLGEPAERRFSTCPLTTIFVLDFIVFLALLPKIKVAPRMQSTSWIGGTCCLPWPSRGNLQTRCQVGCSGVWVHSSCQCNAAFTWTILNWCTTFAIFTTIDTFYKYSNDPVLPNHWGLACLMFVGPLLML